MRWPTRVNVTANHQARVREEKEEQLANWNVEGKNSAVVGTHGGPNVSVHWTLPGERVVRQTRKEEKDHRKVGKVRSSKTKKVAKEKQKWKGIMRKGMGKVVIKKMETKKAMKRKPNVKVKVEMEKKAKAMGKRDGLGVGPCGMKGGTNKIVVD